MRAVAATVAAAVLAVGVSYQQGRQSTPFFFPAAHAPSAVPALAPGVHFSGFDAPADRTVQLAGLLWNQWAADGTGTARFEVLDQGGAVQCYIDVDCAAAPGVDTRSTCTFVVPAGEHINLQANASNTCSPDGQLLVAGSL